MNHANKTQLNGHANHERVGKGCDPSPRPSCPESSNPKDIAGRLRGEALLEIRPLAVGSVAMLASTLSNQAMPRMVGRLIDQNSNNNSTSSRSSSNIWPSLGLIVLGGGLASFVRTTTLNRAEGNIASRLRKEAFHSLLITKDMEWFQTESVREDVDQCAVEEKETGISPAAVVSILSDDVSKISRTLTTSIANVIRGTSSVCFGTYHMLRLDPTLFGISVAVVPIVGTAAMLLARSVKPIAKQQSEMASVLSSFVEERLTHISMVKMANREEDEVKDYCEMQDRGLQLSNLFAFRHGLAMGFIFAASSGALLLVVNLGGKSVAAGKMSSGQLTSFATYSFLLGLGTSSIVKSIAELWQGMASAERFYRLVDTSDAVVDDAIEPDEDVVVKVESEQSIALKEVCFRYKSTGRQVLNKVSFELARGNVLALVGENGSGKSTVAGLLAGLYRPLAGSIELSDGTDTSAINRSTMKKLVQVVPQSTSLFNKSILENVRYSHPGASTEAVHRALKMANCEGFVSKLDGGINFVVGLNGSKLSGGQRQRLALARAVLSDPSFLIMDEPASSLDTEGESAVSEALLACRNRPGANGGLAGRGLLLITHNAKSLELVDKVIVLKGGAIVEQGTLDELRGNRSSELCRLMPSL